MRETIRGIVRAEHAHALRAREAILTLAKALDAKHTRLPDYVSVKSMRWNQPSIQVMFEDATETSIGTPAHPYFVIRGGEGFVRHFYYDNVTMTIQNAANLISDLLGAMPEVEETPKSKAVRKAVKAQFKIQKKRMIRSLETDKEVVLRLAKALDARGVVAPDEVGRDGLRWTISAVTMSDMDVGVFSEDLNLSEDPSELLFYVDINGTLTEQLTMADAVGMVVDALAKVA